MQYVVEELDQKYAEDSIDSYLSLRNSEWIAFEISLD